MTQKQLSERIDSTQPSIARLERDERLPNVDTLYRLAHALGVEFVINTKEPLTLRPRGTAWRPVQGRPSPLDDGHVLPDIQAEAVRSLDAIFPSQKAPS
ncbi:MAG: XRE family transcriptional regulator [Chloroflexota bacterium]|nr:MAG: XRE family transcriptional regulator [Chloroflexota bacterium]